MRIIFILGIFFTLINVSLSYYIKKDEVNVNSIKSNKTEEYKDLNKYHGKKKNKKIKVSIIIPTYNSEKFIGRCLDSALNQTLKEIEIIVIDDYSMDSTRSILMDYAKKDKRVKPLFKKKNSGAGTARNIGLFKAKGRFVGFIDSDDYVDPGWFQYLYENSKGYDLVRGIRVIHSFVEDYHFSIQRPYGCIIPSIIRRRFLKKYNIIFPMKGRLEDRRFKMRILGYRPRTNKLPNNGIFYHYVLREGSLSNYIDDTKNITNASNISNISNINNKNDGSTGFIYSITKSVLISVAVISTLVISIFVSALIKRKNLKLFCKKRRKRHAYKITKSTDILLSEIEAFEQNEKYEQIDEDKTFSKFI